MYRDNKIQDIENIFKNKITRKNKMCNIGCLYANCGSSLPIKKQCYQGIELYVITESLTINEALLTNCCKTEEGCPPESLFLEVRSNQALCVGYTSYCSVHSIVFENCVPLHITGGGRLIVFHQHTLVNSPTGNICVDNGCILLDSDNCAKLINYGNINLKSSYLVGQGTISNAGKMNFSCYSKVLLGKEKQLLENKENTASSSQNTTSGDNAVMAADASPAPPCNNSITYGVFQDFSTKFINTGIVIVNSYSVFELIGSFLQGGQDLTPCYTGNITPCTEPVELECEGCLFHVLGASKFSFTFGKSADDTMNNDITCNFVAERDTDVRFFISQDTLSKNLLTNRGRLTFNGNAVFQDVNVDNFDTIQSTFDDKTVQFFYAKMLFHNTLNNTVFFRNRGTCSVIQIAPTCLLAISGYSVINEGLFVIGAQSTICDAFDITSPNACNTCSTAETANEVFNEDGNTGDVTINSQVATDVADESKPPSTNTFCNKCYVDGEVPLTINAKFYYGYIVADPANAPISFTNNGRIYVCQKSIFVFGKKSSQLPNATITSTRQVTMYNFDLIRNNGIFQVSRNSEIVCRPPPFRFASSSNTIINGNQCSTETPNEINATRAILVVKEPKNRDVTTGGLIRVLSSSVNIDLEILNSSSGYIIYWKCLDDGVDYNGIDPPTAIKPNGGRVDIINCLGLSDNVDPSVLAFLNGNNVDTAFVQNLINQ